MSSLRFAFAAALAAATLAAQGPPPPPPPPPPPAPQVLPAIPFPTENPLTEEKRVLGKILFWDEQMSSSDTVACGTCHRPGQGGTDPRLAIHPGLDGVLGTPDDVRGSPGVALSDAANNYVPAQFFGFNPQVGKRRAPSFDAAAYDTETFWDGRAGSTFLDPDTGNVLIASGGALENQALAPLVNDAEMAHVGRTFAEAASKLSVVKPLHLATNVPGDMASAIALHPTYADLFASAFGDPAITAARVAMAIATYERTVFPNQTAYDAFAAGVPNALTANQTLGRAIFFGPGRCAQCHSEPTFADDGFHNLGLRPIAEDDGRQGFTNDPADRGKFKTPSLRNVALRPRFFHNGLQVGLAGAVGFYNNGGGIFPDNKDPILNGLQISPFERDRIVDFLNALTDSRAATGQFPFDRPTLRGDGAPPNANRFGPAGAGSGGFQPQIQANAHAYVGNGDFRIGVFNALGGGTGAILGISGGFLAPAINLNGVLLNIDPALALVIYGTFTSGAGPGGGFATAHFALPDAPALAGFPFYAQWFVGDPAASGGIAESQGASFMIF